MSRSVLSLSALCVLTSLVWFAPSTAHAVDGAAWLSLGGSSLQPGKPYRQLGVGAQLGLNLSIQERWGLQAGADVMRYVAASEFEIAPLLITDGFVGVRYNLDYFKYVPYLSVNAVVFAPNTLIVGEPEQGQVAARFGSRLTLGMLWRPRRHWSLGGHLDLTGSIPDFGLSSALWIDLGYHWRW